MWTGLIWTYVKLGKDKIMSVQIKSSCVGLIQVRLSRFGFMFGSRRAKFMLAWVRPSHADLC